jgi:hypothetical protein
VLHFSEAQDNVSLAAQSVESARASHLSIVKGIICSRLSYLARQTHRLAAVCNIGHQTRDVKLEPLRSARCRCRTPSRRVVNRLLSPSRSPDNASAPTEAIVGPAGARPIAKHSGRTRSTRLDFRRGGRVGSPHRTGSRFLAAQGPARNPTSQRTNPPPCCALEKRTRKSGCVEKFSHCQQIILQCEIVLNAWRWSLEQQPRVVVPVALWVGLENAFARLR